MGRHGSTSSSPTLFFEFLRTGAFEDLQMKSHFVARHRESYLLYDPHIAPGAVRCGRQKEVLIFFLREKPPA